MKRAISVVLSLLLLLAACAPTIQTPGGTVQVPVVGGPFFLFSNRVAVEALTPEVPDDTVVTFPACQNTGVRAGDVRRFGVQAAHQTCRQVVQTATDTSTVLLILGFPVVAGFAYVMWKLGSCLFGCFPG